MERMSTPVCAFAGSPGYLYAARVGSHGTIHAHGNRSGVLNHVTKIK